MCLLCLFLISESQVMVGVWEQYRSTIRFGGWLDANCLD